MFCAAGILAAQNFNVSGNLQHHVEYLASDALQGRTTGSEGESAAASYIYSALRNAGVEMLTGPEGQTFRIKDSTVDIASANIVGVVEGSDPELRNEYIVVGAHIDNSGSGMMTVDGKSVARICPGADGNASGVATLIEVAKLVSDNSALFDRSVVFVAFGAGECGCAGAWYFVNRAFSGTGSVKAMVNLDMLGRGNDRNPFRIYSSLSRTTLNRLMEKTAECPVVTPPVVSEGTFPQSDYLPFHEKGIPFVHFTTGRTKESHTVRDVPQLVLYKNMERNCNYIFFFLKTLAGERRISAGVPEDSGKEGPVYAVADLDKRPQFFHSDERHFLEAWVYKYVRYPESAIRDGVRGRVQVSFIVEKDGKVSDVEVVKGVDERLDDEAVRVITISPKWIPGEIKGKPVRTRIILPVEFRLK